MTRFIPNKLTIVLALLFLPACLYAQDSLRILTAEQIRAILDSVNVQSGGTVATPPEFIITVISTLVSLLFGWIATKVPDWVFRNEYIPILTMVLGVVIPLVDNFLFGGGLTKLAGGNMWTAVALSGVGGGLSTWLHQMVKQAKTAITMKTVAK